MMWTGNWDFSHKCPDCPMWCFNLPSYISVRKVAFIMGFFLVHTCHMFLGHCLITLNSTRLYNQHAGLLIWGILYILIYIIKSLKAMSMLPLSPPIQPETHVRHHMLRVMCVTDRLAERASAHLIRIPHQHCAIYQWGCCVHGWQTWGEDQGGLFNSPSEVGHWLLWLSIMIDRHGRRKPCGSFID